MDLNWTEKGKPSQPLILSALIRRRGSSSILLLLVCASNRGLLGRYFSAHNKFVWGVGHVTTARSPSLSLSCLLFPAFGHSLQDAHLFPLLTIIFLRSASEVTKHEILFLTPCVLSNILAFMAPSPRHWMGHSPLFDSRLIHLLA